jgi:putative heme-binding domain-containing protein
MMYSILLLGLLESATQQNKPDRATRLDSLVRVLARANDVEVQRDILRGMQEGFQGRRDVKAPAGWTAVYRKLAASKDAEIKEKALVISVLFGDPLALAVLRTTAGDPKASLATRKGALETLVQKRAEGVVPLLRGLVTDRNLRGQAIRGLAAFDDPGTPVLLLKYYASLSEIDKASAVATLASRPAFAMTLLEAVERKKIDRKDLSAYTARQLAGFNDKKITAKLNSVWGTIRPTAGDKGKLLAKYLALVPANKLKNANRSKGREVFQKTCASCHVLFDAGGKIGPELTGSQRIKPEYILSKVLDPNAVVARDYQVTVVRTSAGRTISGIVKEETDKVLTLQTPTEIVRVPQADVEDRNLSTNSLMPEGQLGMLSDAEVVDLIAYVAGPGQAPLPKKKTKERGNKPGNGD